NVPLVRALRENLRALSWEEREQARDRRYDLVINLEDTLDVGRFAETVSSGKRFGAYVDGKEVLRYTEDSHAWFDLSLISVHGRTEADRLKYINRRTFQDLIFSGLGFQFDGAGYVLPEPGETDLAGDIAIAPEAGSVWPMKNWAYYKQLKARLEAEG